MQQSLHIHNDAFFGIKSEKQPLLKWTASTCPTWYNILKVVLQSWHEMRRSEVKTFFGAGSWGLESCCGFVNLNLGPVLATGIGCTCGNRGTSNFGRPIGLWSCGMYGESLGNLRDPAVTTLGFWRNPNLGMDSGIFKLFVSGQIAWGLIKNFLFLPSLSGNKIACILYSSWNGRITFGIHEALQLTKSRSAICWFIASQVSKTSVTSHKHRYCILQLWVRNGFTEGNPMKHVAQIILFINFLWHFFRWFFMFPPFNDSRHTKQEGQSMQLKSICCTSAGNPSSCWISPQKLQLSMLLSICKTFI